MSVYMDMATAQFENVNSQRRFPFVENCTLVADSGKELPLNVVVDVHMVVPADIAAPKLNEVKPDTVLDAPTVRLSSVYISSSMLSVCFTSDMNGVVNALSVTIARANFISYVPYRLEKLYGASDIGGIVTFGNVSFPGFPETYRFADKCKDNAVIHQSCIAVVKPARLRSIFDPRSGQRVAGDVNIDFSGYIEASQTGKCIALTLEDGAADELISTCEGLGEGSDTCGATPIRSINGIRPDEDGNIVLWFH